MTVEADLLLKNYLKRLKLPTLAANYRRFAQEASQSNQPYERYLLALAEAEVHHRESWVESHPALQWPRYRSGLKRGPLVLRSLHRLAPQSP